MSSLTCDTYLVRLLGELGNGKRRGRRKTCVPLPHTPVTAPGKPIHPKHVPRSGAENSNPSDAGLVCQPIAGVNSVHALKNTAVPTNRLYCLYNLHNGRGFLCDVTC